MITDQSSQTASLQFGPLTASTAHLCIDMQRMFAEPTARHVPWMSKALPAALRIARAFPARTIFTRFIPPARAEDALGTWRRYFERWAEFTWQQMAPELLSSLPAFLDLVPAAQVIDKRFYSPFTKPDLHRLLQCRHVDALVLTGDETDVCVLAAVLDAIDLDYRVVRASDAPCGVSDEAHGALPRIFDQKFRQKIKIASSRVILSAWV